MDRRTTLQWMLAASASLPLMRVPVGEAAASPRAAVAKGYGTDPDLAKTYRPGELWPLTFTAAQRRTATALCDLIIPMDGTSPGASAVGVVDFLDEWISAPYPRHREDRTMIVAGLEWLDAEAARQLTKPFADLEEMRQRSICDEICYVPKATPALATPAKFFARYRDLTAGGFYSTPVGREDVQYIGNVPMLQFEGPPAQLLRKLGLDGEGAGERRWRPLFDGGPIDAWRGWQSAAFPQGWRIVDGALTKEGVVDDLVTREEFGNFELELEWKIGQGGNSGIFYRGTREYDHIYWSAPEYQLLDDENARDGRNRLTSTAAAYGLHAAPVGVARPFGEWNTTRIVARGAHVEHWLNGRKVVEYELWTPEWKARVAQTKFSRYPNYGLARRGHIALQGDHQGVLQVRSIHIRELP
jgi:hypothetical protein